MDRIKKLRDFQDSFAQKVKEIGPGLVSGNVPDELASKEEYPVSIKADFSLLIGEISALNATQNLFKDVVAEVRSDLGNLMGSKNYEQFVENFNELVQVEQLKRLPQVIRGIVHMEVGLTLSFVAATKNLAGFTIEDYENSFNQYFFTKNGYKTVAGNLVTAPRLPKVSSLADIKDFGSRIDAERYIRDMTRIIVETSGDSLYNLRKRYPELVTKYKEQSQKKLIDWYDSFGDLAEASTLPVIEGIISGAFNMQLNPLVAAAVGTFCSLTVRKATEHSYLTLLGME